MLQFVFLPYGQREAASCGWFFQESAQYSLFVLVSGFSSHPTPSSPALWSPEWRVLLSRHGEPSTCACPLPFLFLRPSRAVFSLLFLEPLPLHVVRGASTFAGLNSVGIPFLPCQEATLKFFLFFWR